MCKQWLCRFITIQTTGVHVATDQGVLLAPNMLNIEWVAEIYSCHMKEKDQHHSIVHLVYDSL